MDFVLRPAHLGFRRPGHVDTAGSVSAEAFKSACHSAARAAGNHVEEFRMPEVTPNFYVAHILEDEGRTAVLGHMFESCLAFARPLETDAMSAEFIDHERLAVAFRDNTGFRPLDTKTLNRPLTDAELASLGSEYAKELRYWRADTVGKAMFNWFD